MSIIPQSNNTKKATPTLVSKMAKSIILKKLASIELGSLTLYVDGKKYEFGNAGHPDYPDAVINVKDMRVFSHMILDGDPAAGKSYIDGWWTSDNLLDVLSLFALNQDTLFGFKFGICLLKPLI